MIMGDLDLLTIKKDERLHQVMDVMLGNTAPAKNEADYSGVVISDDEETEGISYFVVFLRTKLFRTTATDT